MSSKEFGSCFVGAVLIIMWLVIAGFGVSLFLQDRSIASAVVTALWIGTGAIVGIIGYLAREEGGWK